MSDARLDAILASARPYIGSLDEWEQREYKYLPVVTRVTLHHLHGAHDEREHPTAYCPLCQYVRTDVDELEVEFT